MWGSSPNYPIIRSYAEAEREYNNTKPLRGKLDFRPLDGRNSRAKSNIRKEGDKYVIQLYNTDIVTYYPNGDVELQSGGWNSTSTATAIGSMSPFACWTKKGYLCVSTRHDMPIYQIPRTGLLMMKNVGEGVCERYEPVSPVPMSARKTRVLKDKAKTLRKYFAEVPKMIKAYGAVHAGVTKEGTYTYVFVKEFYRDESLCEAKATHIALSYLSSSFDWRAHTYTYRSNADADIARFWKDVYAAFDVVEHYDTQLPLGVAPK